MPSDELINDLNELAKAAAKADFENGEHTLIDPMWAWLEYELDPEGPEGFYTAYNRPRFVPVPYKVICATCGQRSGKHHGVDGKNCDQPYVVSGVFRGATDRRFVSKKKTDV